MSRRATALFLVTVLALGTTALAQTLQRTESSATHLILGGNPIVDGAPVDSNYFLAKNEVDFEPVDIDHDGDVDVLVAVKGAYTPNDHGRPNLILINDGTGVLSNLTATYSNWLTRFDNTRDIEAADVDGDGWEDAIAYNAFGELTEIYRNLGNDVMGNWQGFAATPMATLPGIAGTSNGACEGRTVDFDLDGDLDIVRANYKTSASVTQYDDLWSQGPGLAFSNASSLLPASFWQSSFGAVVQTRDVFDGGILDLNGDGYVDILLIGSSEVKAAYTDGMGGFVTARDDMPENLTYAGVAADFDRDGRVDIWRTNDGTDFWLRNTSTGVAGEINETQTDNTSYAGQVGGNTHVCDMNGDGLPDVFVNHVDVDLPNFISNQPLFLYVNTGNLAGMFVQDTTVGYPLNTFDTATADFDGDGIEDVLTASIGRPSTPQNARFYLYLSDPTGSSQGFRSTITLNPGNPNLYDFNVVDIPLGSTSTRSLFNLFSLDLSGPLGSGPILGMGADVLPQFSYGFPFHNILPNVVTTFYVPIARVPGIAGVRYSSVMVDFANGSYQQGTLRELLLAP
ncbi:MAG: VCBS repeat-containing protein [Planctomycetes bacterium]|nr:VCBS repeat-containing protein [Planctomycetota bacterium]